MPTLVTADEVIAYTLEQVELVEDARGKCVQERAAYPACDGEFIDFSTGVGEQAVKDLSRLQVPGLDDALAAAGELAAPDKAVSCKKTQDPIDCIFAGSELTRNARALKRALHALQENL